MGVVFQRSINISMQKFINFQILLLAFFVLLFPNSFPAITAALMVGINFFLFLKHRRFIVKSYFVFVWLFLSAIFVTYISFSDIAFKFKFELFLKYVFFPFLWLNIFTHIKENIKLEFISKTLFFFSFLSFFVVFALYFLMLNGYNYAEYFIEDPNIDSNYFLGFTLHVFGNLIFFAAGIFVLPDIFKNKILEFLYVILFVMVTLISGRTALLMSISLGLMILLLRYVGERKYKISALYVSSFVLILLILAYYTMNYLNYSFLDYMQSETFDKLKQLGGEERTSQTALMLSKIINNPWGVGFNNIGIERNFERSFKYEVLILATILRFGIVVFVFILVSLIPVFSNFFRFTTLSVYQKFFLIGLVSIIVFSFTNPYLESFSFQWMFFCPLVFLCDFSDEKLRWGKELKNNHNQV